MKIQVYLSNTATPLLEIDDAQYERIGKALYPKSEDTRPLFFHLQGVCAEPKNLLKGKNLSYDINVTTVAYVAVIEDEFDTDSAVPRVLRMTQ